ncbi:hypothetical protein GGI1_06165 [Acidithiobacillus sp. GGI-221]|nr:hypothetical protein GGI1_06165 [Acidithiobacillus sp. GGI-221]
MCGLQDAIQATGDQRDGRHAENGCGQGAGVERELLHQPVCR